FLLVLANALGGCLDSSLKTSCDTDGDCKNGNSCVQRTCQSNATLDFSLPSDLSSQPIDLASLEPMFDIQVVVDDLATGNQCACTGGVIMVTDMAVPDGCSLLGTCNSTSYSLSCSQGTCQCSKNGSITYTFSLSPACGAGNNYGTWPIAA